MNEHQLRILLHDIETVVAVGIRLNDIDTLSEKKAQIDLIKWILLTNYEEDQDM